MHFLWFCWKCLKDTSHNPHSSFYQLHCWRAQKQSEGEWDETFNERYSNKRYFLHTILPFGLIPSSLIHSVSCKRKDQQGSMCGYRWDCSDRQWFHGNSFLASFPPSIKCTHILRVCRVQARIHSVFTNTDHKLSWTWMLNLMSNIISVRKSVNMRSARWSARRC